MRRLITSLLLMSAAPLAASPPPPPPAFVVEAGEVLRKPAQADAARIAPFFAADVTVVENGKIVAKGKTAWLVWWTAAMKHYEGRTLGSSEGWSRDVAGGGELMVIDTFDDLDRSTLPPKFLVDPRLKTRTAL